MPQKAGCAGSNKVSDCCNIGIKDIFECFMMVLNYRAAEY